MSNPSFSNIDRWLFELMEGNLSPEQVAQLKAFLIQHPELDVDKDMWELAKVDDEAILYPHQQKLVRRRPVGLYMSLGFASIFIISSFAVFDYQGAQFKTNEYYAALQQEFAGKEEQSNTGSLFFDQSKFIAFSEKTGFVNNTNQAVNTKSNSKQNSSGSSVNYRNVEQYLNKNSNSLTQSSFEGMLNPLVLNPINQPTLLASNLKIENSPELITKQAEELEVDRDAYEVIYKQDNARTMTYGSKSIYKQSFSSKLNKMGRAMQRMLDNPVALKNMKDPYYHVPGMQAMDINFGAVGTLISTRVQSVSRAQWLGEENQQFINQISLDGYSHGMRGGLGFQFNHNLYGTGVIQNYNAALIYSPKFSVTRNLVVEPSIRFKMGTKMLNNNQIQTGTTVEYDRMNAQSFYSNGETPIGNSMWYKDLGLGLMVNTKWFFVGIQGDNLLRHYDNIYSSDLTDPRRAGKHYVVTMGTDYESKKENITVSPYIVYQQKEKLSEAWLGVNFRYHWLTVGGGVSSSLEPAASIGLKFDRFMLTYNADYTNSQLLSEPQLSHQLTIRFTSKPSRFGQKLLNQ